MAEQRSGRQRLCNWYIPEEAVQHACAAREEMRKSIEALLPAGFVEHRRAARIRMLQAMRSMIDSALERLEEGQA